MQITEESMRINKFLSTAGYCSRREADRLILAGRVRVDGTEAEPGTMVQPGQTVFVDDSPVGTMQALKKVKPVLIAVNKPVGIVCSTTDNDRAETIVDLVDYPSRIYPVGRLDKDSEGLILMTNRGDLVNRIMKASSGHEKEYLVRVDKALTDGFVDKMRAGVHLAELQVTTKPCRLEIVDRLSFKITLTQGLNRQIRRMCEALGFHVVSLRRIRIMNVHLGNLKTGTWRNVSGDELKTLEKELGLTEGGDEGLEGTLKGGPGKQAGSGRQARSGRQAGTGKRAKAAAAAERSEERYKERRKAYFKEKSIRGKEAQGKTGGRSAGKAAVRPGGKAAAGSGGKSAGKAGVKSGRASSESPAGSIRGENKGTGTWRKKK